ncbi:MAG: hypothetical protein ACE5F8_01445 [Woeseiaceae bacterium]
MTRTLATLLLFFAAGSAHGAPRFIALDVYLNSPDAVAAWQFELKDLNRSMSVVGIEDGDSDVFNDAPYYDRNAVNAGAANRVIVADFSIACTERLPQGETRIATIHVMVGDGEPDFDIKLITATTRDGKRIDASISLREHNGS